MMYQQQSQQGHIPHAPSRFNPNPNPNPNPSPVTGFRFGGKRKLSSAQGRGTMSMPTSPLGQSVNNEPFPWDSGVSTLSTLLQKADREPQSAQAFFSQPPEYPSRPVEYPTPLQSHIHNQTQTQAAQQPTHIAPSYLSSSSDRTTTLSPLNDLNPSHRYGLDHDLQEQDEEYGHGHEDAEGRQGDDVPPPRKKRAQVRVACTHCQKACKKCSNTRPCERCVKYGLDDCMDSMRKPRKTGIKRGPYKRRTSSLYQQTDHQLNTHLNNNTNTNPHPQSHAHTHAHVHGQYSQQPNQATLEAGTISQAFAAAFDGPRWINGRRESISQSHSHSQSQTQTQSQHHPVYGYNQTHAPIPQHQRIPSIIPIGLEGEGRRGSMSSIFPMGLNTTSGEDPFSRTVSPIGHRFKLGGSGLSNPVGAGMDVDQDQDMSLGVGGIMGTSMGTGGDIDSNNQGVKDGDINMSMAPNLSVVDFAYHHNPDTETFHSAPTSPRGTRMEIELDHVNRASSAEPSTSLFPFQVNPFQTPTATQFQANQPQLQPNHQIQVQDLGRPRKSSLFTLLHSRPVTPTSFNPNPHSNPSPQQRGAGHEPGQGLRGNESPTLFNGPNEMDHDHDIPPFDRGEHGGGGRRMSFWNSMSLGMGMGMSMPNAGGVGRLSLSKGSEGLGLGLGLEHVN